MKIHNQDNLPTIDYRKLKPLQGNLKDLSKANHDKLLNVLTKRGFTTPVFVWETDGEKFLMDGHQRHRVMTTNDLNDSGKYDVPYVRIPAASLKEAKEQLLEITSQYGHMTIEGLDEFAFDLELEELDIHFDAIDMEKLLDSHDEEEAEEDEAPAVDEVNPPVSQLGEIYQLGQHRLMCADSTDFGSVSELMDGKLADMVFTDPPYNTGMTEKTNGGSTRLTHMFEDSYTNEEWEKLMEAFTANYELVMKDDSVAYICLDWRRNHELIPHIKKHFHLSNIIVWDKVVHGLGSDYQYTYELINVCKKGKPQIDSHVGDEAEYQDVWHIQRKVGRDDDHATKKPLELCTRAIKHASSRGQIVLDLFGGSGSTLIAAHQLHRTCYMMELDPKYCDVIRKRYHKLVTGEEDGWIEATQAQHEAG